MNRLVLNVYVKIIFYVCIVSVCLLPSVKANSIEEIISKISTIENRIKVLEKATFNKTNSSQGNFDATNYESIITRQSIQISELQNQIQELTGDIEEVLFSLQSLINNFNNFKADTEMRFSDVSIKTTSEKNETLSSTEKGQVDYDLCLKNGNCFFLKQNEKYSGFTIHLVNEKLDSGKILFQKKIKIFKNDSAKILENKIKKLENKYYPVYLTKYLSNL